MPEENKYHLQGNHKSEKQIEEAIPVSGMHEMYKDCFLNYASYVILERAVPSLEDGLKSVQRRIIHSMKEMDDGRFNKVANIIGNTMQYHPHGDTSIGDALISLGQKDLLIETQGNWGDIRTGDGAAAPRYIEARLSKFALDVVYNFQTTKWQLSYDSRKKEPITFPVKFPLLLAQGTEGIAVGLSTKILPHNFCELLKGCIDLLKGKKVSLVPDFPTGGSADFSAYNEGLRGGKIRVRGRIEKVDSKTLAICNIPFGTTTSSLIDSIVKANEKGKIKIKKVIDNTAKDVEILVYLGQEQSPNIAIDALYAFTDCEVSISPNACVIVDEKPCFIGVNDLLEANNNQTVTLLNRELEIKKNELTEKIMLSSLEQIFISKEMYVEFKKYKDKPSLFKYLDDLFEPFKPQFYRNIGNEDYEKLTQIPMIRITKFDSDQTDEKMRRLENELNQTAYNLAHITEFAINYYNSLLKKYGKGRERKTVIKSFGTIQAAVVAANNVKLYVNRKEGFIGYGIKKDEFVSNCSDLDEIIVFRSDGKCVVTKIQEKIFVGKDILHCDVWKKGDNRTVYNLIYLDGKTGKSMVKRVQVTSIRRDREYDLTKGERSSKLLYFKANSNGEAEVVTIYLTQASRSKVKVFDFDFASIDIKGRASIGNILTKYPIKKISLKIEGTSTLGSLDVWYDDSIGHLNTNERGKYLGQFNGKDRIITIVKSGEYELNTYKLTKHFDSDKVVFISKFSPNTIVSVIYYHGKFKAYYIKRFQIETSTLDKPFLFISDTPKSRLEIVSTNEKPQIEIVTASGKETQAQIFDLDMLGGVKGWKALGNKLPQKQIKKITLLEDKPKKKNYKLGETITLDF